MIKAERAWTLSSGAGIVADNAASNVTCVDEASQAAGAQVITPNDGPLKLRVSQLSKTYGAVNALRSISLDVREGEFLSLLGPSGSGKTTLLMSIAGFVEPTSGRIQLDSVDITDLKPERRDLGMVFQGYALFPHMTVAQNIAFPLKVRRKPAAEIERTVRDALEMVRLGGFGERLPKQLSGGQQQRVALARALCFQPRMLLLDEPLAALDKNLRLSMQAEIQRLHRQLGTTFVYVTHDQSEALSLSDRIAVFRSGSIEQIAAPSALYNEPASRFVASFLGDTNFLQGKVLERIGAEVGVLTTDGRFVAQNTCAAVVGDSVTISIRPESIIVSHAVNGGDEHAVNVIEGSIEAWNYLGSDVALQVVTHSGRTITARMLARAALDAELLSPGVNVSVRWRGKDATLVA